MVSEYRKIMLALSEEAEPDHPVDQDTFIFVRIGKNLGLGGIGGSVTNPLFNHVFRKLGLNAAMIPVDFGLLPGTARVFQARYIELVSLVLEDPKTLGFAAGYPMKDATPMAIETWAREHAVNPESLKQTLLNVVSGGILKSHYAGSRQEVVLAGWSRGRPLPVPNHEGLVAVHRGRLKLGSLMTSGPAYWDAVESRFPERLKGIPEHSVHFTIFGAAGETGKEITETLVAKPYAGMIVLVEHPSKADQLKDLVSRLRFKAAGRDIRPFLSTDTPSDLTRFELPGLSELEDLVPKTPFIVLATPAGGNPLWTRILRKIGDKHVVLSLGYRPDPYQDLRPVALRGADVRNGVNLLVRDNVAQVSGVLSALGFSDQEVNRLVQEVVLTEMDSFLEARGLKKGSLTEDIQLESELREAVRKRVQNFQEDLSPGRIVQLMTGEVKGDLPVLTILICEPGQQEGTILGLLDPHGNLIEGTGLVRLDSADLLGETPSEFFHNLLRVAQDKLLLREGALLGIRGIAVAIVGAVEPDGTISLSLFHELEGMNPELLLSEAALAQGISGPVRVVNDTVASTMGYLEHFKEPTLHFILRPGGFGSHLWNGTSSINLEAGWSTTVPEAGGAKLVDVATHPQLASVLEQYGKEGDEASRHAVETAVAPLARTMVELAQTHGVHQVIVEGEYAAHPVYQRFLRAALRRRNAAFDLKFIPRDPLRTFRGAQKQLRQVDSKLLSLSLLEILVSPEYPVKLRASALRILRDVLRSEAAKILRQQPEGRFADQVALAILRESERIVRDVDKQDADLVQQAIFTLGAFGDATDRQMLDWLQRIPRLQQTSRFALGEMDLRLEQASPVVAVVLRRKQLMVTLVEAGRSQESQVQEASLQGNETLDSVVAQVVQRIVALANNENVGFHEIRGVGVAVGATLDSAHEEVVENSYMPGIVGPLKKRLEQELQKATSATLTVGSRQISVECPIPVRLLNDEETIAVSLARSQEGETAYFHMGGDSRGWRLENNQATPLLDFGQGFSGRDLAQREKQAIEVFLQNRGVDLSTDALATQEPDLAWLLNEHSSGRTYAEKLKFLDPGQLPSVMSQSLQGGKYRAGIARVIEPLFQSFAVQVAEAMIKLSTEQGIRHFILGGLVLSKNPFLYEEMIPEALENARRKNPTLPDLTHMWEVRPFDPREMETIVPPILAAIVRQQSNFSSARVAGLEESIEQIAKNAGGTLQQIRNMRVATFKPSSEVSGPLTDAARKVFEELAQKGIRDRGKFVVALSGGRTPRLLYQHLASSQCVDWDKVYIFSADERKVTADGGGIGYQVVKESLLDFLPRGGPQPHVYRINVDADPETAARVYQGEIKKVLGEPMHFDLMVVGAGADRHIMSLRPGSPIFSKSPVQFVEVISHPEAYQQVGYTLAPPVLERARQVLLLLTGDEKQPVLNELMAGIGQASESPIILLDQLPPGVVSVFTDQGISTAGLEEGRTAQDRVRDFLGTLGKQAPKGIVPTIFGQELQKKYPSFRAFAGLEDRNIFLEDEDRPSLLAKLIAKDARGVIYVGLEKEAGTFMPMAARAGITPRVITPQEQQSFARIILEILAQATGLEEAAIQAQQGFQEFLSGLEELSSGA